VSPTPREVFRQTASAEAEPRSSGPDWLMTFADTMSLLLGFFVLLLSFSTFDETEFRDVAGGVQAKFGGVRPPEPTPPEPAAHHPGQPGDAPMPFPAPQTAERLRGSVQQWDRETRGAMALRAFVSYRGLEVTVPADRVFETGSDRVLGSAAGFFQFVARALPGTPSDRRLLVVVPQGATPPASPQFEDAWALAMARALAARRAVLGVSPPALPAHRVVAVASGDTGATKPELTLVFESPDVRAR
jgi:chemotaxis protein MotB